jgi:hypothetical protein
MCPNDLRFYLLPLRARPFVFPAGIAYNGRATAEVWKTALRQPGNRIFKSHSNHAIN